MKVICTRCGGTNIACEAIVNPNTGKIIDGNYIPVYTIGRKL